MKDKDFAKVYERNYKRSFLFAKSYVHDDLVAEDIAAESLKERCTSVSSS